MSHFTTYRNAHSKSVVATVLAILLQLNFFGLEAAAKGPKSRPSINSDSVPLLRIPIRSARNSRESD
jgi:hypothetical protein